MTDAPTPSPVDTILVEARALDSGDSAVIATDVSGTIVYWNDQATEFYGWRADEVLGKNIIDVTPTRNSSDEAMQIMEQLRRGRTWKGVFILQHRDGRPIYAHVTDIPVRQGALVIGIIGVSRPGTRTPTPPGVRG